MGRNNHSYRVSGKLPGEDVPYTRKGEHVTCKVCGRVSRTYGVYRTVCQRTHIKDGSLVHINEPMQAGTDGVMDEEEVGRRLLVPINRGTSSAVLPLLRMTDVVEGDHALALKSPLPLQGGDGSQIDEESEQVSE